MHAKLRAHATVTVSANVHNLISKVEIAIAFPIYFAVNSKKYQSKGLVTLIGQQVVWRLIKVENKN